MNVIIGLLLVGFGLKILSGKWYIGDKPIFFFTFLIIEREEITMKNYWNEDTKKVVNSLGDLCISAAKWAFIALTGIVLVSIVMLGEIIMKLLEMIF